MIVSAIIIYLIGVFFAFLLVGYINDKSSEKKPLTLEYLYSWLLFILILIFLIGLGMSNIKISPPSLKAFLKIFQKKDYEQK